MNHPFIQSTFDSDKCFRCDYKEIDHSDRATCECCSNSGIMEIFTDMLMCQECINKEISSINAHQAPELQEERAALNQVLVKSREIDSHVQTRMDLFNAETVAIKDLKDAIDADDSIENKHFKLTEVVQERFLQHGKVIFEAKEAQIAATSAQRYIQQYFNELLKKLTAKEREGFQQQNVNYKPIQPKIVKPKKISTKKFDKIELRKVASETGLPQDKLQMIVVQRGITPSEAAEILKNLMEP